MNLKKEDLLKIGIFIDNEFLDKYILLCTASSGYYYNLNYTEKHHIIPFSYFVKLHNITSRSDKQKLRKLCEKVGTLEYEQITKDNIVYLSYYNHCLAHYYLYNCTIDWLSKDNETAFIKMTDRNLELRNCSEAEIKDILTLVDKIRLDTKSVSYKNKIIDTIIVESYEAGGYKLCKNRLLTEYNIDVTESILKARARKFNINSSNFIEAWSEAEIAILKQYYKVGGYILCLKYLPNRTKFAIQARAKYLGLTAPGANKVNAAWSKNELTILTKLYPIGGWKLVQTKLPNRSEKSIRRQANKNKLYVEKK